jgi:hypothetical protein
VCGLERYDALRHIYLFLDKAEGYVNALEKSTSPVKRLREVFEHSRESCCTSSISNP